MDVVDVGQRLRAVFENPPRAAVQDAVALLSASVRQFTSSSAVSVASFLVPLENELLDIYENSVEHNSVTHLEAFITVLYTLRPILPASSIISWFDHIRTALRSPRLSNDSTNALRELLADALRDETHSSESRSREFRKRILELYLFDAAGAESVEATIEDLNKTPEERETQKTWKENLEYVLALDAIISPNESFALLNALFFDSAARRSINALLIRIFSFKGKSLPVATFAHSPFFKTFLLSLLVDNSTSLFDQEVTTLLLILPHMAVQSSERLRGILPYLLAILARALCWKRHPPPLLRPDDGIGHEHNDDDNPAGLTILSPLPKALFLDKNDADISQIERIDKDNLVVKPELNWTRVDFDSLDTEIIPDASLYFTFIYGLFPCNTIAFLRRPVIHLQDLKFDSPFTTSWAEFLDMDEIRSRSTPILRTHAFHPGLIYRDLETELSEPKIWATERGDGDDVATVIAQCARLDNERPPCDPEDIVRNALARDGYVSYRPSHQSNPDSYGSTPRARQRDRLHPLDHPHYGVQDDFPSRPEDGRLLFSGFSLAESSTDHLSLDTSASPIAPPAETSGTSSVTSPLAHPSPLALSSTLPPVSPSPSPHPSPHGSPRELTDESPSSSERPAEVAVAILQRENAQLRDQYHFAAWMKDQLKHHVERLHHDRILTKGEEFERQGLHNRLRDYKAQLKDAERRIQQAQEQREKSKQENNKWVGNLQAKIASFRKEKASWVVEAVSLRGEVKDAKGMLKAQEALLAEAQTKVAELSSKLHFLAPKIERTEEYERRIEALSKQVSGGDAEDASRKAEKRALNEALAKIENLNLLIGSLEHANKELEKLTQERIIEVRRLEQRLAVSLSRPPRASPTKTPSPRYRPLSISGSPLRPQPQLSPEPDKLAKLEAENAELREDVEDLTVMVEKLRADGERARLRQANELRPLSPRSGPTKGALSPATLSRVDLFSSELAAVPPLSLER